MFFDVMSPIERRAGLVAVRRAVALTLGLGVGSAGLAVALAGPASAEPATPAVSTVSLGVTDTSALCLRSDAACVVAPAITALVPAVDAKTTGGDLMPTAVRDGQAQVVTESPTVLRGMGASTMTVTVKGTGQPGAQVIVYGDSPDLGCTAIVSDDGGWSCDLSASAFSMSEIRANLDKAGWIDGADADRLVHQDLAVLSLCDTAAHGCHTVNPCDLFTCGQVTPSKPVIPDLRCTKARCWVAGPAKDWGPGPISVVDGPVVSVVSGWLASSTLSAGLVRTGMTVVG